MGALGIWTWNASAWSQISTDNPEALITEDPDGDGADDIVADLGVLGLRLWDSGVWTQISWFDPDSVIAIIGDSNTN